MIDFINNYYISRIIFIVFMTLIGISVIDNLKNKDKLNVKEKLNINKINIKFLFKMFFLSLFLRIILEQIITLIDINKTIVIGPSNILETIMEFIATCIFAPICEEIIFRFGLYEKLNKKFNIGISILITCIIFSVIHFYQLDGIIILLIISTIWNYAYYKTNNLLYPIIFHFLHNLYALISNFVIDNVFYIILGILSFVIYIILSFKRQKN